MKDAIEQFDELFSEALITSITESTPLVVVLPSGLAGQLLDRLRELQERNAAQGRTMASYESAVGRMQELALRLRTASAGRFITADETASAIDMTITTGAVVVPPPAF